MDLPEPKEGAIFYRDRYVYAALANQPITKGHVVIVWKKKIVDLSLLKKKEYDHLMEVVDMIRDCMLKALKVKKVYLLYMDEIKHVHWHLIPAYDKKGIDAIKCTPKILTNTRLTEKFMKELPLFEKLIR